MRSQATKAGRPVAGETPVSENDITALLASDGGESFKKPELALDNQGVRTYRGGEQRGGAHAVGIATLRPMPMRVT
jgi:hypothetical protein